jgi:hypothetical protein
VRLLPVIDCCSFVILIITKNKAMKKGKYIDHNILLACLSKRPQAITETIRVPAQKEIVQEFYEALALPVTLQAA